MNHKEPVELELTGQTADLFGIEKGAFAKMLQNNDQPALIQDITPIDCINRDFYGGRGEKTVIRIRYNQGSQIELFIKRHCRRNPNEARHYIYLSEHHAPIPRLYAYHSQIGRQDIIITELIKPFFIDDDPVFMADRAVFEPFIETTARFNAVPISDEYRGILLNDHDLLNNKLRPFDATLNSMFEAVENDPIYLRLKKCVSGTMQTVLSDLLRNICDHIGTMEKGLYHWDHKPRNFGWSETQQSHVIFDLEDTLWGPRFYNIGMWLGGDDQVEEKYAPREQLAELYLGIYNEQTRNNVSVDCLLHESYPLWVAYKIETLLVYFYEAGANPYRLRDNEPSRYKREMEDKFIKLLNLLCDLRN